MSSASELTSAGHDLNTTRFAAAREKLKRVPESDHVALVEGDKVRMTLAAYEGLAQQVRDLERRLRNTPGNQSLLQAIESTIDRHHPSNEVQLLRGSDAVVITALGHDLLTVIEEHVGDLP